MNHLKIQQLGKEMNRKERSATKPKLRLVLSNSYSWYERALLRINRHASSQINRQNKAGLRLVD